MEQLDSKNLYKFALLITGSQHLAETVALQSAASPTPLQHLWHKCSSCKCLQGEEYAESIGACGSSDRMAQLLKDLTWDERGVLLFKILLSLSDDGISASAGITTLKVKILFRSITQKVGNFAAIA